MLLTTVETHLVNLARVKFPVESKLTAGPDLCLHYSMYFFPVKSNFIESNFSLSQRKILVRNLYLLYKFIRCLEK